MAATSTPMTGGRAHRLRRLSLLTPSAAHPRCMDSDRLRLVYDTHIPLPK
ncbi:hypothetical protein ACP70R_043067 [Stipagrostis hirtigluma subsp. patula]